MTKLLKQAFALPRTLPDNFQNQIARQLIRYVHKISFSNDNGRGRSIESGDSEGMPLLPHQRNHSAKVLPNHFPTGEHNI